MNTTAMAHLKISIYMNSVGICMLTLSP